MYDIEFKTSNKLVNYESSIEFMKCRIKQIQNNKKNELLWFLNHDHIYTQGTSADESEIINYSNIRIIKSNRGGKTTYHGPGQRIVYFLIDLNKGLIFKAFKLLISEVIKYLYLVRSSEFRTT